MGDLTNSQLYERVRASEVRIENLESRINKIEDKIHSDSKEYISQQNWRITTTILVVVSILSIISLLKSFW